MLLALSVRIPILVCFLMLGAFAYHQTTQDLMVNTASAWLASLNSFQRASALFKMDNPDYEVWHFVPDNSFQTGRGYRRNGLTYKEMTSEQRSLADALLAASLSRSGYIQTKTIMSLEEVLRIKEEDTAGRRDVELYHVSVFGTPSREDTWAWRLEGHHVSLHFLMKDGELASTSPTFFGANPHAILSGPRMGTRPLGSLEDHARELMMALSDDLQKQALIDEESYRDILTAADTRAHLEGNPQGIPASQLDEKHYQMLLDTAAQYATTLPAEQAEQRMMRARNTPREQLFFAWAGSIEPGKGDYYRIQAPDFLIEYANTQNQNNHSHTVWRDFAGDFGRDVLAAHYRQDNHNLNQLQVALAD